MKSSRLLNKKFLSIVIFFLFVPPIRRSLMRLNEKSTNEVDNSINSEDEDYTPQNSIYEMQSQKNKGPGIEQDQIFTLSIIVLGFMTLQKMD